MRQMMQCLHIFLVLTLSIRSVYIKKHRNIFFFHFVYSLPTFFLWSFFTNFHMLISITLPRKTAIAECTDMVLLLKMHLLDVASDMRTLFDVDLTKSTEVQLAFFVQAHDEVIYGFWS